MFAWAFLSFFWKIFWTGSGNRSTFYTSFFNPVHVLSAMAERIHTYLQGGNNAMKEGKGMNE